MKQKRCLVVDDNEDNRFIAEKMVSTMGFAVEKANSGREALLILAGEKFDVVLMDWHMPEIGGIDFLNLIRKTTWGKEMTIIIYSAIEDESSINKALASGAQGFIPKPTTKEKIQQEFEKLGLA